MEHESCTNYWVLRRTRIEHERNPNASGHDLQRNPAYWCQLLTVAGDVHPNPGPPKWPCGTCGKNVSANDLAHECYQCATWFHLRCSPLTQLPAEGHQWRCNACTGSREHPTYTDPLPLLLTRFNFELPPDLVQEPEEPANAQRLGSEAGSSRDATAVLPGVGTLQRPDGHQRPNQQAGSGGGPQDTEGRQSRAPSGRNSLRILHWNAGGLQSKLAELLKFLADNRVDIVMLQETHLKPTKTVRFPGYNIIRKDRQAGRAADGETRGGGVLTLIREGLGYEVVNAAQHANDRTTDSIHVAVHLSAKERVDIVNVYVPPIRPGAADDRQQNFDPRLWPNRRNTLICGDVNGHSPQWDRNCDEEDAVGQLIVEWMLDNNFMPANSGEATRFAHDGHGTAPDVTLHHATKLEWRTGRDLGSDHIPILISYQVSGKIPERAARRTLWNNKKADWSKFKRLVDEQLAASMCADDQLASKNAELVAAILRAAEESIPRGNRKNHAPVWTPELEAAVRERNHARRHAPEQYTEAAQRARTMIADAKRKHWEEFTSTLNAHTGDHKTWRVLKAIDGRAGQPRAGAAIIRNDRMATTPKAKANAFASEYAAVSRMRHDREDRQFRNAIVDEIRTGCDCEYCQDFTKAELEAALEELQPRKAPGEDGVTNEMLKQLPDSGRNAVLDLANASWRSKRCPGKWTSALIVPIPKAGKDASDVQSYRPISLTSCIAKTVERMVKQRLTDWLERNQKLSTAQAGFRKMRCTEDQLIYLTQSIKDGFNQKPAQRTLLTLVDFSRAFDRVWRNDLYSKMVAMGIPTCIIQWVRGFLSDRRARVRIDDTNSRSFPLKAGTPQGSVLSPILFLIFINDILEDMPEGVEATLYADDLALWTQGTDLAVIRERMQEALENLAVWAECWKMQINVEKTVCTFFTTEASQSRWRPELSVNGQQLPYDAAPTFLGVTLDWSMRFTAHAKKVRSKM